jgi:hypothetical protein
MVSKRASWSEKSLPDQAGIAPTSEGESGQKRADRSAVTNGTRMLPGIDGRNAWPRRCRDIMREHLGGGQSETEGEERWLTCLLGAGCC